MSFWNKAYWVAIRVARLTFVVFTFPIEWRH